MNIKNNKLQSQFQSPVQNPSKPPPTVPQTQVLAPSKVKPSQNIKPAAPKTDRNPQMNKSTDNFISFKEKSKDKPSQEAKGHQQANTQRPSVDKKIRSKSTDDFKGHHVSTSLTLLNNRPEENLQRYLNSCLKQLEEKKSKLYSCIEIFNLLQSNSNQLRCIQHNNVLTLYCLTERRVLCVNCIYGVSRHRTHKILPLKDSLEEIDEDNRELKVLLENDLKQIEESIRISFENSRKLDKQMKSALLKLELSFKKKNDDLKALFQQRKAEVSTLYQPLIDKSRSFERGAEQFKFRVWESLSKMGLHKKHEAKSVITSADSDVIKQVFCVSLVELTKLSAKKISNRQFEQTSRKCSTLGK